MNRTTVFYCTASKATNKTLLRPKASDEKIRRANLFRHGEDRPTLELNAVTCSRKLVLNAPQELKQKQPSPRIIEIYPKGRPHRNEESLSPSPESEQENRYRYDLATWAMYHRITNARIQRELAAPTCTARSATVHVCEPMTSMEDSENMSYMNTVEEKKEPTPKDVSRDRLLNLLRRANRMDFEDEVHEEVFVLDI